MQEKESITVVRCELKIPPLGITVRHHSASLMMPNSYLRDGIFNQHLTIIKDSYNPRFSHGIEILISPRRSAGKIHAQIAPVPGNVKISAH